LPEVFNTDQGCQSSSEQFPGIFDREGCPARLSMDGKGRAYDNIFVERFWRTLKYEDVYLKGYGTVTECRKGLDSFIPHKTPCFARGYSSIAMLEVQ